MREKNKGLQYNNLQDIRVFVFYNRQPAKRPNGWTEWAEISLGNPGVT